ncbi:MAG: cob(I)yrinic acid a,c-diamide adenosyltransferase [Betaproteobacteria bacterium]|nr:cob(I)yrinic acid a,c-diamide adenosyltransferase [Betaproteobacteria bacterium]MDE2123857.1 cob(I)yrinic acid a,c-diamide adenosyltransferase [Betaproteobacteria bacterium]MDE2186069.1 cob(I)yrinic acid a,c-diamide adenosyltransferase [Betaproteobacteria bacterium]MDE2325455.1 cob(I)yrinic acid a,c-diamide adenosyltransferase [Betaproteobacteria bacterium]
MGHRLTAITTRTGDAGTTGLGDGSRRSKADDRIQALGDVDELNSHIGLLLTEPMDDAIRELLLQVQHDLFDLGGELAVPGMTLVQDAHVQRLDTALAHYNPLLPPLKEFILPGGTRAASLAHVCRTVARRAERSVVAVVLAVQTQAGAATAVSTSPADLTRLLQYLNRLSDLLFVLARTLNRAGAEGSTEVYWKHERKAKL